MGDTQQQHVSGNNINRAPIYGRLLSMRRKTLFFFSYCAEGLTTRKATWGHCAYLHFTDEENEACRGGGGARTPGPSLSSCGLWESPSRRA